jgi:hypothetical protein
MQQSIQQLFDKILELAKNPKITAQELKAELQTEASIEIVAKANIKIETLKDILAKVDSFEDPAVKLFIYCILSINKNTTSDILKTIIKAIEFQDLTVITHIYQIVLFNRNSTPDILKIIIRHINNNINNIKASPDIHWVASYIGIAKTKINIYTHIVDTNMFVTSEMLQIIIAQFNNISASTNMDRLSFYISVAKHPNVNRDIIKSIFEKFYEFEKVNRVFSKPQEETLKTIYNQSQNLKEHFYTLLANHHQTPEETLKSIIKASSRLEDNDQKKTIYCAVISNPNISRDIIKSIVDLIPKLDVLKKGDIATFRGGEVYKKLIENNQTPVEILHKISANTIAFKRSEANDGYNKKLTFNRRADVISCKKDIFCAFTKNLQFDDLLLKTIMTNTPEFNIDSTSAMAADARQTVISCKKDVYKALAQAQSIIVDAGALSKIIKKMRSFKNADDKVEIYRAFISNNHTLKVTLKDIINNSDSLAVYKDIIGHPNFDKEMLNLIIAKPNLSLDNDKAIATADIYIKAISKFDADEDILKLIIKKLENASYKTIEYIIKDKNLVWESKDKFYTALINNTCIKDEIKIELNTFWNKIINMIKNILQRNNILKQKQKLSNDQHKTSLEDLLKNCVGSQCKRLKLNTSTDISLPKQTVFIKQIQHEEQMLQIENIKVLHPKFIEQLKMQDTHTFIQKFGQSTQLKIAEEINIIQLKSQYFQRNNTQKAQQISYQQTSKDIQEQQSFIRLLQHQKNKTMQASKDPSRNL